MVLRLASFVLIQSKLSPASNAVENTQHFGGAIVFLSSFVLPHAQITIDVAIYFINYSQFRKTNHLKVTNGSILSPIEGS